jgi:uroporphyrinogen III methyltransferase/synthase
MRWPITFVGLGGLGRDALSVRALRRLREARVLVADAPLALDLWAPQAAQVSPDGLDADAVGQRLLDAWSGGEPAVRVIPGLLGESLRALDEARFLLRHQAQVEVLAPSAQDDVRIPWRKALPLVGRSVAVTRPRADDADALSDGLARLGAAVLDAPALALGPPDDVAPLDRAIARLSDYGWVVLTSAAGVRAFVQRLLEQGRDLRALRSVAAVGPATADALLALGIRADLVPTEARGEGLAAALRAHVAPTERLLLARAAEGREVLPEALHAAGYALDVVATHQTRPVPAAQLAALRARLEAGELDALTFASVSAARALQAAWGTLEPLARTQVACLGPVTADGCRGLGIRVDLVAAEPSFDALAEALTRAWASPPR